MMWVMATLAGGVGSYLPVALFHADSIGAASILCGTIGSVAGILVWFKYMRG